MTALSDIRDDQPLMAEPQRLQAEADRVDPILGPQTGSQAIAAHIEGLTAPADPARAARMAQNFEAANSRTDRTSTALMSVILFSAISGAMLIVIGVLRLIGWL